ncbi:MAG: hypothetical protein COU22_01100 [Candidatus Komeilibacteria bacterium CG10_big_fil_rev_8_21_14_0_10_41_13]|uniref:Uncharacterized protein n=1 Tax=Candidatus Komeilibacteria bacterium CG10_big_fil_rev_8_21_14_0_10_41_13 TaxID=1974476 RepID=A0A2M6WCV8_9BACT|nr:MAG: hypothetical protein COU22_01100 [Candidatus Komeilibacteria bacterium CG10_big_fil_rev_8_21_14_0_10_41_13]
MAEKRKYQDRAQYLIKAVAKRRKNLRSKSIEHLGGKCQSCGYAKYEGALEFHHLDSRKKDFGLSSKGMTRSWEKIRNELDKCILLCANCHREIHGQKLQLPVRKSGVNTR